MFLSRKFQILPRIVICILAIYVQNVWADKKRPGDESDSDLPSSKGQSLSIEKIEITPGSTGRVRSETANFRCA